MQTEIRRVFLWIWDFKCSPKTHDLLRLLRDSVEWASSVMMMMTTTTAVCLPVPVHVPLIFSIVLFYLFSVRSSISLVLSLWSMVNIIYLDGWVVQKEEIEQNKTKSLKKTKTKRREENKTKRKFWMSMNARASALASAFNMQNALEMLKMNYVLLFVLNKIYGNIITRPYQTCNLRSVSVSASAILLHSFDYGWAW